MGGAAGPLHPVVDGGGFVFRGAGMTCRKRQGLSCRKRQGTVAEIGKAKLSEKTLRWGEKCDILIGKVPAWANRVQLDCFNTSCCG